MDFPYKSIAVSEFCRTFAANKKSQDNSPRTWIRCLTFLQLSYSKSLLPEQRFQNNIPDFRSLQMHLPTASAFQMPMNEKAPAPK